MKRTVLATGVRRALEGFGVPSRGQTVVVGLSGGADSVALTEALASLAPDRGFRVLAAHLDHGLRPESIEDVEFCGSVCDRLGVALRTGRADVRGRARRERGGLEEAARHERYAFLRAIRDEEGAAAIAVAHTRDDQIETLLMRLLRGAGSTGLSAMRPRTGDLLRPLLEVSREQVLEHLRGCGLPWREDSTNGDLSILRNRIRHELLPYLEARFNPNLRATLGRTAGLLRDEADVLASLGDDLFGTASRQPGEGVALTLSALRSAPRAVARLAVRRAIASAGGLRGVSRLHVDAILALASSKSRQPRRLPLPGHREAVLSSRELSLGPRTGPARPAPVTVPAAALEARP